MGLPDAEFTVGAEEEFHLLDTVTGQLRSDASDVLAVAGGQLADEVEPELLRTQIETGTPVCSTLDELRTGLGRQRRELSASAARVGCQIAASGTWPGVTPPLPVTANDRYEDLFDRFGPTARQQAVCGCHIHVRVDDPDLRIAVVRRSRPWLATLLALSANSPFWEGVDTTYASYRSQVWARWPTAGTPPPMHSRAEYDDLVDALLATGVMRDRGMLYWDVRASERYDTVEFRVADVCLRVDDAVLLAALARGLARSGVAAELAGRPAVDPPAEVVRLAHWQAARYGISADLIDPSTGRPAPAGDVIGHLVEHLRPALAESGDEEFVDDAVRRVLEQGTGAARQRAAYRRAGRIDDVIRVVAKETEAAR